MILRDKDIREIFQLYHNKRFPSCKLIHELRVNNGNAIADLVSVGKAIHCYEIKSDADNINRAIKQSKSYDITFNKVTLVTTKNHVPNALKLLPEYWGIISIEVRHSIKVKYIRRASISPIFSARSALNILWKEELLSHLFENGAENVSSKLSRIKLIDFILDSQNKGQVRDMISNSLKIRDDKYGKIVWDLTS